MATRIITRRGVPVQPRSRFEFYAWLFTRVSGVILLLMAVFHILYMHFYLQVGNIDFNLIATRWSNPLWRIYDFVLLAFGFSHGMNGARVVLEEYIRGAARKPILIALGLLYVALILMGAWIIFTFKSV